VYPLWLCCRRSTTIQPDTPPTFKFLNTRFSYNSLGWGIDPYDVCK
jgi:hypothetical protein